MAELVGAKTDLRRVGSRLTGLCPFHDERTPSFSVDAERKLYHCFGCGEGGDAIGFVQETEALDFPEAVELLGGALRRAPRARGGRSGGRAAPAPARAAATRCSTGPRSFYASYCEAAPRRPRRATTWPGAACREEILREFRVGYAPERLGPDDRGSAAERLHAPRSWWRPGSPSAAASGGLYDRFRGRIMFPLADARGRVLGFGARAMAEGRGPKYLNTSENERLPQGPPALRARHRPQPRRPRRSRRGGRGLHGCARAAPGGHAGVGRDHGYRAHPGAAGRAGPQRRRSWCWPWTRIAPARRPCFERPGPPSSATWS